MVKVKQVGSETHVQASGEDTRRWATRPGFRWPASTLAGRSVWAAFGTNGDLVDTNLAGEIDAAEFNAFTSDVIHGGWR